MTVLDLERRPSEALVWQQTAESDNQPRRLRDRQDSVVRQQQRAALDVVREDSGRGVELSEVGQVMHNHVHG